MFLRPLIFSNPVTEGAQEHNLFFWKSLEYRKESLQYSYEYQKEVKWMYVARRFRMDWKNFWINYLDEVRWIHKRKLLPLYFVRFFSRSSPFNGLNFSFPSILDVVRKVEAVLGKFGQLSCNLTSDIHDDRVALVIWYKEGKSTPVYSYDARDSKAVDGGSHHGINLDGKFYFNTSSLNPATFSIANLTADDEGTYRCRVDFIRSPTKNTKVQLSVIVPPENLLILNEKGKHIPHYILGPYNEGSSINLTCISSG